MRTRLRLVRDEGETNARAGAALGEHGFDSYKFPGGVREVLDRPDPRRMSSDEVAALADQSLRRMQEQLHLLKQEACAIGAADMGCRGALDAGDLPDRAA